MKASNVQRDAVVKSLDLFDDVLPDCNVPAKNLFLTQTQTDVA
jgi:hypothetical protein